jgi:hypothetical protein
MVLPGFRSNISPSVIMPAKLFLSHDHRDHELARALATALKRVTLSQLDVWFSTDASPQGGILPGRMWLDEIRGQLAQSRALIVLLTPTSLTRPHWLLFECGFAATNPACEVVPLCLGINTLADVPAPFSVYQCYQLADYESLRAVVAKLATLCGIAFDEEMARPVLQRAIADFTKALEVSGCGGPALTLATLSDGLKEHIDRRFRELIERQEGLAGKHAEHVKEPEPLSYPVMIHVKFPQLDCQNYTPHG